VRLEVLEEVQRDVGDGRDRLVEGGAVGLGRRVHARELAHVLQRRGMHLLGRRRRSK
jgi:hypothetical protein